MPIYHVSHDFNRYLEDEVPGFAAGIQEHLYGNTSFPSPTVPAATFAAALSALNTAFGNMADAGPSATAAKNTALATLLGLLRQLANYVELVSNNEPAVMLSSGFHLASTSRAQHPLPQASIRGIAQGASGSLLVEANLLDGRVRSWEGRWKPAGAPDSAYQPAQNLGATRKMTFINLPVLTQVTIQMRGVGGSTGYGDWSDGVTHAVT